MDRKIQKKKWTLKRIATWGGASVFVIFILYSFIFADGGSRLNVEREKVNIATVMEGEFREFIPVDGSVMPIKTIRLDAIEGGVVEKKYYEGGILVDKGDTILKLSNNDLLQNFVREETQAFILMNSLENTKLSLKRNQFELKRNLIELDYQIDEAKDAYVRGQELYDEKIISEQEYLNLKRAYDRLIDSKVIQIESAKFDSLNARLQIAQAESTLNRTRDNLEMIKKNLDNLYFKAPISGSLSTVNAEVGESISPGQNIGQIDDLNGFKVRAAIDEHYIARIYQGLSGTFDFAGGSYTLQISKVYPEVANGLFSVDMVFTDTIPQGIRRGQTLQIRLQLSENITAVQIPRGSFYQTTGGNWIFVLTADESEAVRRQIRLGRQNPRYYEVIEGLQPGEKVVVSSYEGYDDKDKLVFK
ncbi:efflux RND transporter periplasmic adaptor subunit [Marinoscillum sp. 108]|uniref:Efflux RND transporter periplasmic adaptor subunit n=1 Tax=Marinoscillum luteum TaxID=861051 RepID=A0ABW7N9H5_9BACT|nr:efflux RND transporter periplasmic adaptor subunit [Marinoscillum sp. 108]VXD17161.1 Efflux transporter periplasmic adaptor subunit [Marinoscillum sp. 108]